MGARRAAGSDAKLGVGADGALATLAVHGRALVPSAVPFEFRALRVDAQANIVVCEDLIISVLHDGATGEVYETMHEGRDLVRLEHPKVSLLSIVPGHPAKLGSAAGREAGKASLKRMETDLSAMALVIEAGSLASTLTRTIMNTMSLVTQRRYGWKTFANVPEAAVWLAPNSSSRLAPDDIVDVAERVRALTEDEFRSRAL